MKGITARIRSADRNSVEVVEWDDPRANEYRIVLGGRGFDFSTQQDALAGLKLLEYAKQEGRAELSKELRTLIGTKP